MNCNLLYASLLSLAPTLAQAPAPCEAHLDLGREGTILTVTGRCRNLLATPGHYRYELLLDRQGQGGRSHNQQGGAFDVPPRQEAVLARQQLNATPKDALRIRLRILSQEGRLLAQDSVLQSPEG
ncbi:curli-like amyloid fiber formation chaperone CsgH [Hymenobacter cavernae]|uniref:Curli assembly protein CsgC n=1 Tax=Hymenobacter cavernae TaxID=2044852 RepID=A0ABQ1TKQ9_9BACT|nr:curli-like amyloid fiber formation chaperone CsgH [Hymenobacter cavernae]GGE97086.1 hypothetical protein GCM10011383_04780 [Hymenobacter cavernae]